MPVSSGVVGLLGGPAGPDHPKPGASEDSGGVRMPFPAGAGIGVELGGPGVSQSGVVSETGDCLSGAGVHGPTEVRAGGLSGGAGNRRGAAFGGGLFGAVDSIQDRADPGQQLGQVDHADTRQPGEQSGARMSHDSCSDQSLGVTDQLLQRPQQLDLCSDHRGESGGR